jgi:hypothetical protein
MSTTITVSSLEGLEAERQRLAFELLHGKAQPRELNASSRRSRTSSAIRNAPGSPLTRKLLQIRSHNREKLVGGEPIPRAW